MSTSLQVETLEDRLVPSTTATLSNGVLMIKSTDANQVIRVEQANGWVDDTHGHGFAASQVQKIVVFGGTGTTTIDLSKVMTIPVEIHGSGNNTIYGGHASDLIYGGAGWNIIFGEGVNTELHGTGSYNRLIAGPGTSKLYADHGLNFMDGGENRGGHPSYFASAGTLDYAAEAFAPGNNYTPDQVVQGTSNYCCYFESVLAGMAASGVKFDSYIHFAGLNAYGQGIYNVSLYNGRQWITESVIFDGQTNRTGDDQAAGNLASWAIIMTRAWDQFHGNTGGAPAAALSALGRDPSTYTSFSSAYSLIAARLSEGYTVIGGTKTAVSDKNLVTSHAYTVLGVGTINDVACVLLRNPWGFNLIGGAEKSADIWISWSDFVTNFSSLTIG